MQSHIGDVRQAVRYAASDCTKEELPGFCLPKKVVKSCYLVVLVEISEYL